MCGIAGLLNWPSESLQQDLESMSNTLIHRGPDAGSFWYEDNSKIGLAHRRLSILDLSPSGLQPMTTDSQRWTMVFNGEIYNYKTLQKEIKKEEFSSWGDSRVLLECIEQWGIEKTLKKLTGMYAIALWDSKNKTLSLARDPIGIKPLYYTHSEQSFAFSSEMSALSLILNKKDIEPKALASYFKYNSIPQPNSLFQQIKKCPPGHLIHINKESTTPEIITYSPITLHISNGIKNRSDISYSEAKEKLKEELLISIQDHLCSDVPLGCFLSGGIDSSLVCAMAQNLQKNAVKTFTIGMHEEGYNEAEQAKSIANHLKTDHKEFYLNPDDMAHEVPSILDKLDEPFADSSLIPTYFVSKMTRQYVTVSLSGDGGDELFCGYTRYKWSKQIWSKLKYIPSPLRHLVKFILESQSPQKWDRILNTIESIFPGVLPEAHMGQKLHRLATMIHSDSPKELYHHLISHTSKPFDHLMHEGKRDIISPHTQLWNEIDTLEEKMMATDLMNYLPDDILTKVDRASMMVSLEARVPLLTPKLVELAWSLPLEYKKEKRILKDILYDYVPKELMDRPKMGFGIAIGEWIKGPLRPWAEDLLETKRISHQGIINNDLLQYLWSEHKKGAQNNEYMLWNHLVFQHWWKRHHE